MAKEKDTKTNPTQDTNPTGVDIDALVAEKVAEALAKAKADAEVEAEAKAKAEAEAERKQREEEEKRGHELVPCFIPYIEGEPEEMTVGFNGKLYKIMKGEEVEVPRFIYEIIVRSGKLQMANHRRQEALADIELNA